MTYFPYDAETIKQHRDSAMKRGTEWEKLADESWWRAMVFVDEFCAKLNYKAALEAYDMAATAYREAERLHERYVQKIAA